MIIYFHILIFIEYGDIVLLSVTMVMKHRWEIVNLQIFTAKDNSFALTLRYILSKPFSDFQAGGGGFTLEICSTVVSLFCDKIYLRYRNMLYK